MKLYYMILALLLVPWTAKAQNKNANYVVTRQVIGTKDTLTSIEYFDGLGRSSEVVKKGYSGAGDKDLVSMTEYDGMGYEHHTWNPTPFSCTGNAIDADAFKEAAKSAYADQTPFSEYEYDKTSGNQIVSELGPGYAWHQKKKARTIEYGGVATMKYPWFTLSSNKLKFSSSRYYFNSSLTMVKVTDEDGISTSKYYDLYGHLVMEQKNDGSTTFYLYDRCGNLIYVLPPTAYNGCLTRGKTYSIETDENLQKYAYFYRYDGKNRCIEKKLPGCEPIKMIYDKENRLIFKQDGNQRAKNEWLFMLYDSYGRVTVRGVCYHADTANVANTRVVSSFSTSGKYDMYNANISLDVKELLKANYYDSYAFLGKDSLYNYQLQNGYDRDISHDGNKVTTRGLLTGCRTYVLPSSNTRFVTLDYHTQAFYYNTKGEVVQIHKDNGIGGIDDIYYHRNPYTGSILQEKTVHNRNNMRSNTASNTIETVIKRYTYDKNGRLDSMMYKLNNNDEFLVKHCEYDDLGRVAKTTSHADALSTNYTYNVRGQLTSATNQLTEQHIYYNTSYKGQNTLAYNGDISAYEWKGYKDGEWDTESYSYDYDDQNRQSSAYSLSQNGSEKAILGQHDTHYEYDLMGNITNITRKGVNWDDEEEGYRDDATLEYDGNQLVHISNKGYKDSSSDTQIADREYSNATEFQYDANGNMTRNLNKGILKTKYNVLNLPEYIYMKNNQYQHNIYDGDGNKLSSEIHTCKYNITIPESGSIQGDLDTLSIKQNILSRDYPETTHYCGDFIYKTKLVDSSKPWTDNAEAYAMGNQYTTKLVLSRINFEEGYIVPNTTKNQVYDYIKDYLGNVRFVEQNDHVDETNNYYPFGGFYKEDNNNNSQRWKFGGKELDRTVDQYYWGFRIYDPTVGVFTTVDPMCELNYAMTPYSFANNNPINYTDLFGLKTYSWDDFVKHWQDFDVNNDDVELPNVYCITSKPDNQDGFFGETSDGLGRLDSFANFLKELDKSFGGSNLSKPLYEMNKYVKYNYPILSKRLQLSRFHPNDIYKGITKGLNQVTKYTKYAGWTSTGMTMIKIVSTGNLELTDAWDTAIPFVLSWIPGYGWAIAGGYLLLDTGVKICTGKDIGEHVSDFTREQYGYDTIDLKNKTLINGTLK